MCGSTGGRIASEVDEAKVEESKTLICGSATEERSGVRERTPITI